MAMGTRKKRERQRDLWIATKDVVEPPGNAFYDGLNKILDEHSSMRRPNGSAGSSIRTACMGGRV
jgi:hypothetical protein